MPSDRVMEKAGKDFKVDAEHPGVLKKTLDFFSSLHENEDVKLAFDGKKLALGFGEKLGEAKAKASKSE